MEFKKFANFVKPTIPAPQHGRTMSFCAQKRAAAFSLLSALPFNAGQ